MQGSCISEHDTRTMEMEYMQLAEQKHAKWKGYDNAVIYANAMHEYDAVMIYLFTMPWRDAWHNQGIC